MNVNQNFKSYILKNKITSFFVICFIVKPSNKEPSEQNTSRNRTNKIQEFSKFHFMDNHNLKKFFIGSLTENCWCWINSMFIMYKIKKVIKLFLSNRNWNKNQLTHAQAAAWDERALLFVRRLDSCCLQG